MPYALTVGLFTALPYGLPSFIGIRRPPVSRSPHISAFAPSNDLATGYAILTLLADDGPSMTGDMKPNGSSAVTSLIFVINGPAPVSIFIHSLSAGLISSRARTFDSKSASITRNVVFSIAW